MNLLMAKKKLPGIPDCSHISMHDIMFIVTSLFIDYGFHCWTCFCFYLNIRTKHGLLEAVVRCLEVQMVGRPGLGKRQQKALLRISIQ